MQLAAIQVAHAEVACTRFARMQSIRQETDIGLGDAVAPSKALSSACQKVHASGFTGGAHMQSNRLGNDISFSDAGGVEIEENWDRVKKITLDTEQPADAAALAPLLSTLPLELRPDMEAFIQACYEVCYC